MTRLFALFVVLTVAGCLPGPESLIEDADLEVIVTGVKKNDVVSIDVGGASASATAAEDVVSFFVEVGAGDHDGSVVVERKDDFLCASFAVSVDAGERAVVGVDVDKDDTCPTASERAFLSFEEEGEGVRTTIDVDGLVVVIDGEAAPRTGRAKQKDLEKFLDDVTSPDADELFAGTCEPRGGDPREPVLLTRVTDDDSADGGEVIAVVDVANCRGGVASKLRAHAKKLRDGLDDD